MVEINRYMSQVERLKRAELDLLTPEPKKTPALISIPEYNHEIQSLDVFEPVSFSRASLIKQIKNVFNSKVKPNLRNYIERPGQIELSSRIAEALKKDSILLAEAGVGTGKSFSYLVPITMGLVRGPIVISTKTIILQDQLYRKDTRFFIKLSPHILPFLAKGQYHFLCKDRYRKATFPKSVNKEIIKMLDNWVQKNTYGDRSDAPSMNDELWESINVEDCSRKECNYFDSCGFIRYKESRRNWNNIIICNHDLLVVDLMLRARGENGLWKMPGAIIIDEAHGLADSCRQELSQEISIHAIEKLLKKASKNKLIASVVDSNFGKIQMILSDFFTCVQKYAKHINENPRFLIANSNEIIEKGTHLAEGIARVASQMDLASGLVHEDEKMDREIERLTRPIELLREKLFQWTQNPNDYFLAGQFQNKDIIITIAPVSVSPFLSKHLWIQKIPLILTSGTISVEGDFSFIKNELGLSNNWRVTEYAGQTSLTGEEKVGYYFPWDLPKPKKDQDDFTEAAAARIAELLKITNGRALVLFTSHDRMEKVFCHLYRRNDLPWTILKQGQDSVKNLLNQFRDEETSILLATGSFWEGVDIVGPSLSMVIMDKLPFPSPDPLIKTLVRREKEAGRKPLDTVIFPEMLLRLKQGAGRLLRNEDDWGIISVLDVRIANYHQLVNKALPPGVFFDDLTKLKKWYEGKRKSFLAG
ncbi:ATP-dependent DNA helicase [Pelotomaculum isophthalicicum JI]|uniref:ATP-dependent DNA helicase n=1 Tax=Pelotomaculum isophthalicicum JI TaxID=947010 RepID=A0A9X4H7Z3_9FIRM|nr:ATP-dependent DNA helicase [Pelotomaculum isophthalicicum]MDF9408209.1 ATP-dependent DNA helicase [Pelotomaculum isophthalicicum JI]